MDLLPWMTQWDMLPPKGGTILCAVSGGRDSMCLLHYLHRLGRERGFTVAAAHLDHHMRPTAARDVAIVTAFCRANHIPLRTGVTPVYEKAEEWRLTVEEAGRRARYEFLAAAATELHADKIATAHHQNDQAETVLLNLLRGTGPAGLAGIPPVRDNFIRPLLNTPRSEIEDYVAEHHIPYGDDETNFDLHYARNRLRRSLWPLLEEINPQATAHIAAAAAILRQEDSYLDALAAACLPPEGAEIDRQALLSAPEALQSRLLRQLIDRAGGGKKDVSASHLRALLALCRSGGTLPLPGGVTAVCRGDTLRLVPAAPPLARQPLHEGANRWGKYTIILTPQHGVPLPGPFTVRPWQGRDRMTLPGSRGSRTVKRLLMDAAIPRERWERLPVICCDGKPVFIPGVGPAETGETIQYHISVTMEE